MTTERDELEHRLRVLEEENARLVERQEEIALLGVVSDRIHGTEDPLEILAVALERIAILRGLSLAAACVREGTALTLVEHHSAVTDAPLAAARLQLSARVAAAVDAGPCLLRGAEVAEAGLAPGRPLPISPRAALLLPFAARAFPRGLFLLCDDGSPDALDGSTALLEGVVDTVAGRLDVVTLLRELTAVNAALDERVRQRTAELLEQVEARRRSDEALRHAQKMDSIGRLAGTIAHDFNNVLTSIIGIADVAAEGLPRGSALAADLGAIREAGQHAAQLTRQLLAFSRRQHLEVAPVGIDAVCGQFAGMLSRLIGERVRLRVDLGAGDATVLADRGRLEQVLMNLAVNARDAMPAGGTLALSTRLLAVAPRSQEAEAGLAPGPWVRLSVADDGEGMAPAVLERAFEPFFTTKGEGKGTGLGLATVYGIVKQHGGEVTVASTPGAGTRFDVYLPRAAAPAAVDRSAAAAEDRRARPRSARILVVDDEPAVRRVVARILAGAGFTVTEAASGAEALAIAEGAHFDALVTDVVMPGMGGTELAAAFGRRLPGRPVLFISGYAGETRALPELASRTGFLAKPINAGELVEAVDALLAGTPGAP